MRAPKQAPEGPPVPIEGGTSPPGDAPEDAKVAEPGLLWCGEHRSGVGLVIVTP